MDVMRVDTADGKHRFSICVASYGYMGDLMRTSEKLRWMGPPRYNTAGALTLFKGRSYQARVSYKPADTSRCACPVSSIHHTSWFKQLYCAVLVMNVIAVSSRVS